jgi:hypothetical protein
MVRDPWRSCQNTLGKSTEFYLPANISTTSPSRTSYVTLCRQCRVPWECQRLLTANWSKSIFLNETFTIVKKSLNSFSKQTCVFGHTIVLPIAGWFRENVGSVSVKAWKGICCKARRSSVIAACKKGKLDSIARKKVANVGPPTSITCLQSLS